MFSVTQKEGEFINPADEGVTLDDYESIMGRESHLKGYYKSYLERWQTKKKPLEVKIIPRGKDERKVKLLKDHPQIKEKYSKGNPLKQASEIQVKTALVSTTQDTPSSLVKSKKKKLDKKSPSPKVSDKYSRKFQTSYQHLYKEYLGEKERTGSLERAAKELLNSKK